MAKYLCPKGWIYFCPKCGRTSRDKYGEFAVHSGWQSKCVKESQGCYLEAFCVEEKYLEYFDGKEARVAGVKPGAVLREYPP